MKLMIADVRSIAEYIHPLFILKKNKLIYSEIPHSGIKYVIICIIGVIRVPFL